MVMTSVVSDSIMSNLRKMKFAVLLSEVIEVFAEYILVSRIYVHSNSVKIITILMGVL